MRGAMKIGWVAPVKPSHPYLENGPAPLFDLHYLRISPWLWFKAATVTDPDRYILVLAGGDGRHSCWLLP